MSRCVQIKIAGGPLLPQRVQVTCSLKNVGADDLKTEIGIPNFCACRTVTGSEWFEFEQSYVNWWSEEKHVDAEVGLLARKVFGPVLWNPVFPRSG
jgi:hypothetical protein